MRATIDVGVGPTKLMMIVNSSINDNFMEVVLGAPVDYLIETSAKTTVSGSSLVDGGDWKTAVTVTGNIFRVREHAFDFTGQRFVRLTITKGGGDPRLGNGVYLDEIDLHDVSSGMQDTFMFIGDSITAFSFNRFYENPNRGISGMSYLAEDINKKHSGYYPVVINGGTPGTLLSSNDSLGSGNVLDLQGKGDALDVWLNAFPDMRFWVINYGTNDAHIENGDPTQFKKDLPTVIDRIKAKGKIPITRRAPYATNTDFSAVYIFNAVIDQNINSYGLWPGPDLYTPFRQNTSLLDGGSVPGVHPTFEGMTLINQLWADALEKMYTGAAQPAYNPPAMAP